MSASERRLRLLVAALYVPAAAFLAYAAVRHLGLTQGLGYGLAGIALLLGEAAIYLLPPPIVFYLFFGVLTTLVAQGSFNAINLLFFGTLAGGPGLSWLLPQSLSWFAAVLFAFLTNRYFVFKGRRGQFKAEMGRFFLARLGSGLLVEYLGLLLLVNGLGVAQAWAKLTASIVVVIVNYLVSLLFVFRKESVESDGKAHAD